MNLIISSVSLLFSFAAIVISIIVAHKQANRDLYDKKKIILQNAKEYLDAAKGVHPVHKLLGGSNKSRSINDVDIVFELEKLFNGETKEYFLGAKKHAQILAQISNDISVLISLLQEGEHEKYLRLKETLERLPWDRDFDIENIDKTILEDFCVIVDKEKEHTTQNKLDFWELWRHYSEIERDFNKLRDDFVEHAKACIKV